MTILAGFVHTQQSEGTGEPMVGIEVAPGETGVLDTERDLSPGHWGTGTTAGRAIWIGELMTTYGPDVDAVYRSEQGQTETQAERLP